MAIPGSDTDSVRPVRGRRSFRRLSATAASLSALGVLAACSGGTAQGGTEAATAPASSLAAACGTELTAQLPWWPGVDYAFLFELIGAGGEIDSNENTYSGEIDDTGVVLTLRAGGPAAGFQPAQSLLYQDDSIDLIVDSLAEQVDFSDSQPTVSVFSYYDVYPVIFAWGTDEWTFTSVDDIRSAGAPVLASGTASYLTALLHGGKLDAEQLDPSFDGSPARFVAEEGRIVQQDYITSAPYNFEHVVEEWGKPINFLSVHSDLPIYGTTLQVRSDRLDELSDCLTELVPRVQQAAVDYAADPAATNGTLTAIGESFAGIGVQLTPELLASANAAQLTYGLVRNGTDGVLGSFDSQRVQTNIDLLAPAFAAAGNAGATDVVPADLVTNEFLDDSIALPADVPVPENTLPDDVPGLD